MFESESCVIEFEIVGSSLRCYARIRYFAIKFEMFGIESDCLCSSLRLFGSSLRLLGSSLGFLKSNLMFCDRV